MRFDVDIFLAQLGSTAYLKGALISVIVAVIGLVISCLVGFVIALMRMSRNRGAQWFASVYVWFFRAIPAMLLLLICWNAVPQLLTFMHAPWYTPLLAACLGLGLGEAAYMAETIRAALMAVDDGQRTAARALGMNPLQSMWRVVAPQATRIVLPSTGNEFISLLKLSSIASVISLQELLRVAMDGVQATYRYAEFYTAAIIYYLVLVSLAMVVQHLVERRFRWSSRKVAISRKSPSALRRQLVGWRGSDV